MSQHLVVYQLDLKSGQMTLCFWCCVLLVLCTAGLQAVPRWVVPTSEVQ